MKNILHLPLAIFALFLLENTIANAQSISCVPIISTIAGGNFYLGDNGSSTAASLSTPKGTAVDGSGNVYIADASNNRIRIVSTSGTITTIAGNGITGFSGDGSQATAAELNYPYGVAVDGSGNIYVSDQRNNRIRKILTSGIITTIAGSGSSGGGNGDGGPATAASFSPTGIAVDGSGNIYFGDLSHYSVRKVDISGIITTIAGIGTYGFSGDGAAATAAQLFEPYGIAVDGSANVYITDYGTYRVRKVDNSGIINTIAGGGGFSLDGIPATNEFLSSLYGVAVDGSGNVYISSRDAANIRKVSASGIITTVAGNGITGFSGDGGNATSANLNGPYGLSVDGSGNIYIADTYNDRVRKVNSSGVINTIAGGYTGDGGLATLARLEPSGITKDASGNLYITDPGNNRIRKISATGYITTIAGNGITGYSGDGGQATAAELNNPNGMAIDGSGNIYIADIGNNVIRKINSSGIISTIAGNTGSGYSGDGGPATNAQFRPGGIIVDGSNNLYIADQYNPSVRKINSSGIISTIAGNGSAWSYSGDGGAATAAGLSPNSVALDPAGNLYITDGPNHRIRKVSTSGIISTFAGTGTAGYTGDGGQATAAEINRPWGICVDVGNNVYLADRDSRTLREINSSGIISTIAGNGTSGYSGDGGIATAATLTAPLAVYADSSSNVYIADFAYEADGGDIGRIRYITCAPAPSAITGSNTMCVSASQMLTNGSTGGTWSSSNTSIATVGSSTGIVYGVSGGPVIILYSVLGGIATTTITVNPLPAAISGPSSVCTGSTITLTDGTTGGSWSSSNVAAATIGSGSGIVTGVAAGAVSINYVLPAGCGVTYPLTVNAMPPTTAIITTIAGNGIIGASGDGGLATYSELHYPEGVAVDAKGNVYIADPDNLRVRKIDISGVISTFAGNGIAGNTGDGGPATAAELNGPIGIASDAANNIYISEGYRIRKVDTMGIITKVAGSGLIGYAGDGGAATNCSLNQPIGVAVDRTGNIYIADFDNYRVRIVNSSGIISTIAGNGSTYYSGSFGTIGDGGPATAAVLNAPWGVATDSNGNIYISEYYAHRVRKVNSSGIISTLAGTGSGGHSGDGGPATSATLYNPAGLATDTLGNVFIGDLGLGYIRKVAANGIITTVAGGGSSLGDGGPATAGNLFQPDGVTVDIAGNIYIADESHSRIRKVSQGYLINPITGTLTLCVTGTTALSNATGGGTWSSATPSIATAGSTGIVTGVSAGTAVISYVVTGTCSSSYATATITVNPLSSAGTISGSTLVCQGAAVTLTDGVPGGIWSASSSNATVSGGVVTGVAAGIDTIYYAVTNSCGTATASQFITINPAPNSGAISGASSVFAGSTITLTETATGGTWSAANGNATVTGGVVTGVTIGTDSIFYTVTNSCGTAHAGLNVTVNPAGTISTISGPSAVCTGYTIALSDATPSGTWSSSNTALATVGSVTGVVSGVTAGSVTITYNTGSGTATKAITVNPSPGAGTISGAGGVCMGSTTTLSDGAGGGVWSSTSAVATVGSSTGMVTGLASGMTNIIYTVTNIFGCSSAASFPFIVEGTPHYLYTAVGTGVNSSSGDAGLATLANVQGPRAMCSDTAGNVYISDVTANRIRRIGVNGVITTVAGNGSAGNTGDGGQATAATLNMSGGGGVCLDRAGNLYISNTAGETIRKVNASTGIIITICGTTVGGYSGDGGPASVAKLLGPTGICTDTAGNLYISDGGNFRIRRINALTGIITTIIGTGSNAYSGDGGPGTAARVSIPRDVTTDMFGNLFVTDNGNNRIRKYVISTGIITTIAGTGTAGSAGDGGAATAAQLNSPARCAVDGANNLYIADGSNNKVRLVNLTTGIITTAIFNGISGNMGDGGPATAGEISGPCGIATNKNGDVYVADGSTNRRVRVSPYNSAVYITLSGPTTVTSGTPVNFTAWSSVQNFVSYQWKKNGTNISGATTRTYTDASPTSGSIFTCMLTVPATCGSGFSVTSNSIMITLAGMRSSDTTSGIPKLESGTVNLYPNPVHENLTVAAGNLESGEAEIRVYDELGKVVATRSAIVKNGLLMEQVDVHWLPNAVYLISLSDAGGKLVRIKFVKD